MELYRFHYFHFNLSKFFLISFLKKNVIIMIWFIIYQFLSKKYKMIKIQAHDKLQTSTNVDWDNRMIQNVYSI